MFILTSSCLGVAGVAVLIILLSWAIIKTLSTKNTSLVSSRSVSPVQILSPVSSVPDPILVEEGLNFHDDQKEEDFKIEDCPCITSTPQVDEKLFGLTFTIKSAEETFNESQKLKSFEDRLEEVFTESTGETDETCREDVNNNHDVIENTILEKPHQQERCLLQNTVNDSWVNITFMSE